MIVNVVLIAEDSAYANEIGKALVLHDFCVVYVPDPVMGWHLAREIHPGLILIDLQLPDVGEHLLALQLCKFQGGTRIPVIGLATGCGPAVNYRAAASGCDGVINPGVDSERFAQELTQIMARIATSAQGG